EKKKKNFARLDSERKREKGARRCSTVPGVDQAECVVVTPGWSDRVRLCRSRAVGGRAIIESQLYLRAGNPVGTLGTNTDRLVSVSLRDDATVRCNRVSEST
ncbi:hypothetical protein ALC62_12130, partial [Cyphomyrmex costatus]